MKKITVLFLLLASFVMTSQAQVKFGLKGGLNVTDMSFDKELFETSNQIGFFVGPTVKFTLPLVGLGVDFSAMYDQRSAEVVNGGEKTTLKQETVIVPLNLRYSIGLGSAANVFLFAGPQVGFNIGDKEHIISEAQDWRLKDSNFSVNVGLGLTLASHLQLSANYNIACGTTGELNVVDTTVNTVKNVFTDSKTNSWQISAAYFF